jgi:hypothetical protein
VNNRGAMLVIALAAAGLAAASIAVWYQHRQTRRALDLWGAAAAQRIERAVLVELLELQDGSGADGGTGQSRWDAASAIDISHARGSLHFRRSLLQDANFHWNSAGDTGIQTISVSDWDYAVRFSDEEASVVVLFDVDGGLIAKQASNTRIVRLTEKTSQGLELFFEEAIAAAE